MCVIIIKPKGQHLPDITTLHKCWRCNPDGAGLAYNGDGVTLRKGFMEFSELMKALDSIPDSQDRDVMIHFRYATHGSISKTMTHPFIISDRMDNVTRRKNSHLPVAVAHNGVIRTYPDTSRFSDTALYVRDTLSQLQKDDPLFYRHESVRRTIWAQTNSKFCFLDDTGFYTVGDFVTVAGSYRGEYFGASNMRWDIIRDYTMPIMSR